MNNLLRKFKNYLNKEYTTDDILKSIDIALWTIVAILIFGY